MAAGSFTPAGAAPEQPGVADPGGTAVVESNPTGYTRIFITNTGSAPVEVEIDGLDFDTVVTIPGGKNVRLVEIFGLGKIRITNKNGAAPIRILAKWL